jgi:branched-chain amino acid aminotransferase
VEDGTVCTPSLEDGALPGVTRDLVIELCSQLKIPVSEKSLPMSSLKSLSEVFITSTLREVQPVAMIGERRLFPGAVTIMLRKAYKDLLDDIDP